MHLLRNADVYAPEPLGLQHLLIAGERIVWMGPEDPGLPTALAQVTNLEGQRLVPGFVDCHAHLTGGGGESGYASRVPPMVLSAFTTAGVTTAVGLLGTDDLIHTPGELVSTARGLRELGLTTWCWTGGYHLPPATITGSVRGDIVHVDLILGVGEVAISDHRSSQPTLDDLLRLAAEAHVAGMMTNKAGVVHLHLGDGERGLDLVRRALATAEIPARVFHPTHVNRRKPLQDEAFALVKEGCTIDVTASDEADETSAADTLVQYLDAGLPIDRITMSSDGGGCLPLAHDEAGRITKLGIGSPQGLPSTLRALLDGGVPLETALRPMTASPAALLRLPRVGRVAVDCQADLVVLDEDHRIRDVWARGQQMVKNGAAIVRGTFES